MYYLVNIPFGYDVLSAQHSTAQHSTAQHSTAVEGSSQQQSRGEVAAGSRQQAAGRGTYLGNVISASTGTAQQRERQLDCYLLLLCTKYYVLGTWEVCICNYLLLT